MSRKRKKFRTVGSARRERGLPPAGAAGAAGSRDTPRCGPSCSFSSLSAPAPGCQGLCSSWPGPHSANQRVLINFSFLSHTCKSHCPAQNSLGLSKFLQTLNELRKRLDLVVGCGKGQTQHWEENTTPFSGPEGWDQSVGISSSTFLVCTSLPTMYFSLFILHKCHGNGFESE